VTTPTVTTPETLRDNLGHNAPVWLLLAGSIPTSTPTFPPPSTTGRPLCALGAPFPLPQNWQSLLQSSGGHLDNHPLPDLLPSIYLEPALARTLADHLADHPFHDALQKTLRHHNARIIRWHPLDVHFDPRLRIAEVVTSLQIGGAERVVLDLAAALPAHNLHVRIITAGKPTRAAYPAPPDTIDVSGAPGGRAGRMTAAARAALQMHADLVHTHLLHGDDLQPFHAANFPLALTVHNLQQGWPHPDPQIAFGHPNLLIACSKAVEQNLQDSLRNSVQPLCDSVLPVVTRTVWNGINFDGYRETPEVREQATALRQQLNIPASAKVLLAIANPRPQKRLHRLPAILALVRRHHPETFLVIAGEKSSAMQDAHDSQREIEHEIILHNVAGHVRLPGAIHDVRALLIASDVVVSVSEWEGLSLAHLEALTANRRLVATAAGGTPELAHNNPAVTLLPLDFKDDAAAEAIVIALAAPALQNAGAVTAAKNFTRHRMAERYARLLPRAIPVASPKPAGLLLVTNNFSTGGAQSSARRLLTALAAEKIPVTAAVVQEDPGNPTPGRRALLDANIPVHALPPIGACDPACTVNALLDLLDTRPPAAVLMWNLVTQVKILLADALLHTPLVDVSPGEMYFDSLHKYFRNPRPGLPYLAPKDYAQHLNGIVVKYAAEKQLAEQTLGIRATIIPNGLPVPVAPPPRRPQGNRLILGTSARLSPQKKLEELLNALRLAHDRLPPYILRIAGGPDGDANIPYAESLKEQSAGLNVEWLGHTLDIPAFLADLDFFVMISEPAGCPNAGLEALAAGLPLIATDCGGANEQAVHEQTGLLAPRNDPEALANALLTAAHKPALRTQWSQAANEHARKNFSLARMVRDYRTLLGL
jgi:glycosyltransferase involved in cell wall biosynthesis